MIIYGLIISVLIILITLTFTSKTLSPIPYFPSQKIDLPLIIKSINLKNDQVLFDLGAGDGLVIFAAAKEAYEKKLNTKFIAVEINPVLILILHLRRLFHPDIKNIKIILADLFTMSLRAFAKQSHNFGIASSLTSFPPRNDKPTMKQLAGASQYSNITFYLYISPWFLDRVAKKILKEFPNACIISYMYKIKSLKNKENVIRGKNSIFIYGQNYAIA